MSPTSLLLAQADASGLLAARVQMAWTLGFHIVLACLGIGMPVLLLIAEWRWLRTGDPVWRALARRWAKAFAVTFAVGAVSGTVLSFELGLLWPEFMARWGAVIGIPFTLEGFAFFLEAIFVGIYLYAWDRLPPRVHWLTGVPIALSGALSAWFVVTVNAFMNAPRGFDLEGERVVAVRPWEMMFTEVAAAQTVHMLIAAYLVTGLLVASVYAVALLRGEDRPYHRRALGLGLALGLGMAPLQAASGDWAAKVVAASQPVKLAALEGQFQSERRAPLRLGGLPDEERRRTDYALEVPGLLSWLAYGDLDAEVKGLDEFPRELTPPVAIVHLAFQTMVGIGSFLLLLGAWAALAAWRRRGVPDGRLFLRAVVAAGPLAVVALQAGWVVTEVGRQPWIVQGHMKVAEAVTGAPGVGWSLLGSVVVYLLLTGGLVVVLRGLARQPLPDEEAGGAPRPGDVPPAQAGGPPATGEGGDRGS